MEAAYRKQDGHAVGREVSPFPYLEGDRTCRVAEEAFQEVAYPSLEVQP